jgi:HAMP domain-containing protein
MLERFSIRQAIVGAMAAVTLVAAACITALLFTAGTMNESLKEQSSRLLEDEAIADRIGLHVQRQIGLARRYMDTGDPDLLASFREEGLAVYDQIRLYLFLDLEAQERLLVEQIRERHQAIEVSAQDAFDARARTGAPVEPAGVRELQDQLVAFLNLRRERTYRMLAEQQRIWRWLYVGGGLLVALFVATMFVATAFLRRRLLDPLRALTKAARRVGSGDFDARVDVNGDDELASVGQSFNRMAERLDLARGAARDAEHRFRDLVEGVSTVMWEADAQTLRCTYVSPQAGQLLGYPLADWTTTDIWRTLIHPADYDEVMAHCAREARAGTPRTACGTAPGCRRREAARRGRGSPSPP